MVVLGLELGINEAQKEVDCSVVASNVFCHNHLSIIGNQFVGDVIW